MLNDVSLIVNSCFNDRIGRSFYIALWPAMKNGSTTIIPSAENHGEFPENASASTARPNIHGAKVMLCIWWDQLGVVYYELLKPSETITRDRYRTKWMHLSRALKEKRSQYQERHDKVILQHDNVRPHIARPVKTYLKMLKWEVLPHPPYSPDVAPSDYHLFQSMEHGPAHQRFSSYEEVKKWINS